MTLTRTVVPELLDNLSANDPVAMRSRRDLKRVHKAMSTRSILLRALGDFNIRRQSAPLSLIHI